MARRLLIKVTCGPEDPERCNQAFTVAAAAAVSGVDVGLWLTGEAAWFAVPGKAEEFSLPLATPLADLRDTLVEMGQVTLCTQCADRREITPDAVIAGVRIAGAPVFVEEALVEGTQAIVY